MLSFDSHPSFLLELGSSCYPKTPHSDTMIRT
jgi:hypothetical protein